MQGNKLVCCNKRIETVQNHVHDGEVFPEDSVQSAACTPFRVHNVEYNLVEMVLSTITNLPFPLLWFRELFSSFPPTYPIQLMPTYLLFNTQQLRQQLHMALQACTLWNNLSITMQSDTTVGGFQLLLKLSIYVTGFKWPQGGYYHHLGISAQ